MTSTTPLVIRKSDPRRLAVEWSDGHETVYTAAELRSICPCAMCVNELSGERMHDPASVPPDLEQREAKLVGHYAITLTFSDGHHTGIFTFPFLRSHDPRSRAEP